MADLNGVLKELRIVALGLGLSLPLGVITWVVTYGLIALVSNGLGLDIASPALWIKILLAHAR